MRYTAQYVISLALLLGSSGPALAQEVTRQSCGGRDPVGYIGIRGISCSSCTFSSPGGSRWEFGTEPKIAALEKGSRAADILKVGDVITHVDGKLITTRDGAEAFENIRPGDAVVITVRRNGQPQQFALRADAICPQDSRLLGNATHAPGSSARTLYTPRPVREPGPVYHRAAPGVAYTSMPRVSFGMGLSCSGNCSISFSENKKTAVMKFSAPPEVYSIERGGPADKAGIRRGDVITHINDLPMDSEKGGNLFANAKPGETVRFTIERGSERKTISVRAAERTSSAPQLAQSSEALERARATLTELQRTQSEQMRRLQHDLQKTQQIEQEKLRETQREMLRAEQEHRAKLAELSRELTRVDSRVRAAMADSLRAACPVPLLAPSASTRGSRTLRYTGTVANADIEVRGSNPVSVTESGDEIVITTGGTVVRVKKTK